MTIEKLTKNDFVWNLSLISFGITFSLLLGITLKFIKGML